MDRSVLGEIVAAKRVDVAARFGTATIDDMRRGVARSERSLHAALSKPGARFIMEVKRASPSGHRSTVAPVDAARAYAGVADAISVLTDAPYFHGSLDDLRSVRGVFDGPILAKDFVVDPRQLVEARAARADAVLCMLSVLSDDEASAVLAEGARLGLDVIVEVHDEAEMGRAAALGAGIIGINNRDLKTLRTDLAVTERLAPLAPPGALLISESGIASRADAERLARRVDAFLVGSSLMAAPNVREAARALVFGPIKICGVTSVADAQLALAAGATHVGMIFVPESPRCVDIEDARSIASTVRDAGAMPVGVFRDADPATVIATAKAVSLAAVQLHGEEDEAVLRAIRAGFDGELWAVRGVGASVAPVRTAADRALFDNAAGGGSGQAVDWRLLSRDVELDRAFLAGGIGPANAAEASRVGAFGLDISSGIEALPGKKDPVKMAALFDALRLPKRGR